MSHVVDEVVVNPDRRCSSLPQARIHEFLPDGPVRSYDVRNHAIRLVSGGVAERFDVGPAGLEGQTDDLGVLGEAVVEFDPAHQ
jgi:hypothetical protein